MRVLSTECAALDRLLDGGIEADAITLVFGEGGSGKTNFALQCARSATRQGKRVAFVDTEGVSGRRLEQVFGPAPDGADERLLFFTPFTIGEQERLVRNATMAPDLGLLVIDSINMHYRLHIDDDATEREASRSLYSQLHHLTGFARQKGVPVLVTGQVYGGEDTTQPFARRTMEHLVKALVRFEKRPDGSRRATILKHRSIEEGRQALFRIGSEGLLDLDHGSGQATEAPRRRGRDEARGDAPTASDKDASKDEHVSDPPADGDGVSERASDDEAEPDRPPAWLQAGRSDDNA